jgi:hypothetical protein
LGYTLAIAPCLWCRRPFGFNPMKVPSIKINETKEPICEGCFDMLNQMRKEKGLPLWERLPDAYDACEEDELGG